MPETLEGFVSPRRLPAYEKKVTEIGKDDVRVRLLGMVIDKKENVIVLDDGTGKINVIFTEPFETEVNKRVRVFGRVIPAEEGFEIQGEILQDMSDVDLELYKKVSELEKE
ncbi:MAG: replication protein RepA [Candidatus Aenigmarchaeota archaeon]|nr:replication protein RepA [Candidatus Aenigmarchaeota archaeon]MCK4531716.1 replication protein RepA [Candidatus Aenigmarchaeota archaeon]